MTAYKLLQEMYLGEVSVRSEFQLDGTTYRLIEKHGDHTIAKVLSPYMITYEEGLDFLKSAHDSWPKVGDHMSLPNRTIVITEVVTR
jgi:hypothetical protein